MRIYISSGHKYPGWRYGVAAHAVLDRLARGLSEIGHEVRYHLRDFGDERLPDGIEPVTRVRGDEDILHINHTHTGDTPVTRLPWVRSVHSDLLEQGLPRDRVKPNFIFVSQTLARLHESDRFVLNGLDPADFIYSEAKDNYFLFVISAGIPWARQKGLDIAFRIAKQSGIPLRVASRSQEPGDIAAFDDQCRANNAVFVGKIEGERKAELFAAAKALLFPTQMNEAFGLPVAEALMSGTPVIASNNGAMSELLDPGTGFVCADESDYMDAVANLGRIEPAHCRRVALERFHYLVMARDYVREYQREIERASRGKPAHVDVRLWRALKLIESQTAHRKESMEAAVGIEPTNKGFAVSANIFAQVPTCSPVRFYWPFARFEFARDHLKGLCRLVVAQE